MVVGPERGHGMLTTHSFMIVTTGKAKASQIDDGAMYPKAGSMNLCHSVQSRIVFFLVSVPDPF